MTHTHTHTGMQHMIAWDVMAPQELPHEATPPILGLATLFR